jgi:hypothetical protein
MQLFVKVKTIGYLCSRFSGLFSFLGFICDCKSKMSSFSAVDHATEDKELDL